MPLAAIGIFVMTLGVLATLNLGQAVHQKIKLQNTADAAAYSLAAMEARTFNYIAFLNRAQIAHYNTAMAIQSYMTWVGFQVALFGTTADLMVTLKNAVEMGANGPCPACKPYRAVQAAVALMAQLAAKARDLAVKAYTQGEGRGHDIVEAMALFNRDVVWESQVSRAALLNFHILSGMESTIVKNDEGELSDLFKHPASRILNFLVNGAMNSIEYFQTFDHAAGINPSALSLRPDNLAEELARVAPGGAYTSRQGEPERDAVRIMSELCNASRAPDFVSNRGPGSSYGGSAQPWMAATGLKVIGLKRGQTKFTSSGTMTGAKIPALYSEGNYPEGAYLSSNDFLDKPSAMGMFVATVNYAQPAGTRLGDAIAAYEQQGAHYRYTGPTITQKARISPGGTETIAVPPPPLIGKWKSPVASHARWPGFQPYITFKPKSDRTADFNQPSTWIFLNKHHRAFQTGSDDQHAPWLTQFSWEQGGRVESLDSTVGGKRNSYLFEGLNVVARGMAYYHRPGNWKEHPNFFNPYWRARLAPVGQKLQGFWDRYVTQNLTTTSEDKVVQTAVAVLRGAQMDVFTSFISALITH
jgi:hypothetical protein